MRRVLRISDSALSYGVRRFASIRARLYADCDGRGSMGTALVTGASSGIGRAFAIELAHRSDVDEIWLVARRLDRLEETARTIKVPCRCISADLSSVRGIETVCEAVRTHQPQLLYVVNAAGFGRFGTWENVPSSDADAMLDVNCKAVVDITQAAIPYMPHGSHILEVVSSAAFTPLPHMNVYAATKAFMQSYVRGLRWEVRQRGVCVTAVCPAWVKTEFAQVARKSSGSKDVHHLLFAQKPQTVARRALLGNRLHFAVVCCGLPAFLLRIVGKFIPHCITMAGWEGFRRI
jgi:short-subunit dehydrogenase